MITLNKTQFDHLSELDVAGIKYMITGSKTMNFNREARDMDIIIPDVHKNEYFKKYDTTVDHGYTDLNGEQRVFVKEFNQDGASVVIDTLFVAQFRWNQLFDNGKECFVNLDGTTQQLKVIRTSHKDVIEAKMKLILKDNNLDKYQRKHLNDILSQFSQ